MASQTIQLQGGWFSVQAGLLLWIAPENSRPQIDAALAPPNTSRYLQNFLLNSNGNVILNIASGQTGSGQNHDLSSAWESGGEVRLTVGGTEYTFAGITDTTEPYEWTPSNSADVTAIYNAYSSSTNIAATLVIDDNAPPSLTELTASSVADTTATLTATIDGADSALTVYLRYRADGTDTWSETTASGTTSAVFNLSGLTASTSYEAEASLDSDYGNAQTIDLPSSAFSARDSSVTPSSNYIRWIIDSSRPMIDAALSPPNSTRYFRHLILLGSGELNLGIEDAASGATGSGDDLSSEWETNGEVRITVGGAEYVFAAGSDTSEPYRWTPSNSADVIALYNAYSSSTNIAATLAIADAHIETASFTTTAPQVALTGLAASLITHNSARLTASIANATTSQTVYFRYREVGTTTWSTGTASGTASAALSITGLTASTAYEAEASLNADYSNAEETNWVTAAPPPPPIATLTGRPLTAAATLSAATLTALTDPNLTALTASEITANTATLTATNNGRAATVYLRWRPLGADTWQTATADGTGPVQFDLTGLASARRYEAEASLTADYSDPQTVQWGTLGVANIDTIPPQPGEVVRMLITAGGSRSSMYNRFNGATTGTATGDITILDADGADNLPLDIGTLQVANTSMRRWLIRCVTGRANNAQLQQFVHWLTNGEVIYPARIGRSSDDSAGRDPADHPDWLIHRVTLHLAYSASVSDAPQVSNLDLAAVLDSTVGAGHHFFNFIMPSADFSHFASMAAGRLVNFVIAVEPPPGPDVTTGQPLTAQATLTAATATLTARLAALPLAAHATVSAASTARQTRLGALPLAATATVSAAVAVERSRATGQPLAAAAAISAATLPPQAVLTGQPLTAAATISAATGGDITPTTGQPLTVTAAVSPATAETTATLTALPLHVMAEVSRGSADNTVALDGQHVTAAATLSVATARLTRVALQAEPITATAAIAPAAAPVGTVTFSADSTFAAVFDAIAGDSQGRWDWLANGTAPTSNVGPGTNNTLPFAFTETSNSGGLTIAQVEQNGIATLRPEMIPTRTRRRLRLRVCVQGRFEGGPSQDEDEGLAIDTRPSDADEWTQAGFINGWAYNNNYQPGSTVTQFVTGDTLTVAAAGGWVDFDIDIPDTATQVRFRPRYILAGGGSVYSHDLAVTSMTWATVPLVTLEAQPLTAAAAVSAATAQTRTTLTGRPITAVGRVSPASADDTVALTGQPLHAAAAVSAATTTITVTAAAEPLAAAATVSAASAVERERVAGQPLEAAAAISAARLVPSDAIAGLPITATATLSAATAEQAFNLAGQPITATATISPGQLAGDVTLTALPLAAAASVSAATLITDTTITGQTIAATATIAAARIALQGAPSAPLRLRVIEATQTSLIIEWDPPADDGGQPVTGYTLTVGTRRPFNVPPTVTRWQITDLDPGTDYTITLRASNAITNGPPATADGHTTGLVPPDAPRRLAAAVDGPRAVTLEWEPPTFTGGVPITGWEVSVTEADRPTEPYQPTGSPVPRHTVRALAEGHPYRFLVRAVNSVGVSEPTGPVDAVPVDVAPVAEPEGLLIPLEDTDRQSLVVRLGAIDCRLLVWWQPHDNAWHATLEAPAGTKVVSGVRLATDSGLLDNIGGVLAGNIVCRPLDDSDVVAEPMRDAWERQSHGLLWEPAA